MTVEKWMKRMPLLVLTSSLKLYVEAGHHGRTHGWSLDEGFRDTRLTVWQALEDVLEELAVP